MTKEALIAQIEAVHIAIGDKADTIAVPAEYEHLFEGDDTLTIDGKTYDLHFVGIPLSTQHPNVKGVVFRHSDMFFTADSIRPSKKRFDFTYGKSKYHN